MSDKMYVSLHNHSEYSLIDGLCKIKDFVKTAKNMGMPALALTDHGTLSGSIKFYKACQEEGIKPILGMEAYVCNNSLDKSSRSNNHLLLIAKNDQGWKNLKKLATVSYEQERYYARPRLDFDLLDKYGDGLIVSSACIKGEIAESFLKHQGNEGYNMAKMVASKYKERFKDDYYLELMFHAMDNQGVLQGGQGDFAVKQRMVLENTIRLSQELGIRSVLTNDTHYICKDDFQAQQIKKARQFGKDLTTANNNEGRDGDFNEFYLKTPDEIYSTFGGLQFAIEETMAIAEKCNVDIPLGARAKARLPNFDLETQDDYEAFCKFRDAWKATIGHLDKNGQYLTFLSWKGLIQKGYHNDQRYKDRLTYELSVVTKTEFSKYFIVVRDYIQWAWKNNIFVGPGRGSGAGSLMLFCLGITNIDPILYDLDFERFLAAEKGFVLEERDFVE